MSLVASSWNSGKGLGRPERAAHRVVTTIADEVDRWLPGLDGLPYEAGKVKKLRSVIKRRQQMLRRLS